MEPTKEQIYLRRIAQLEAENAELRQQVVNLTKQVASLTEQVAKLSKNSSNSSKPPSSDIVKPPKSKPSGGSGKQGGQSGHRGVNRQPFRCEQIDHIEELYPNTCPNGHDSILEPVDKTKTQQVVELPEKPVEITEYHLHAGRCPVCGEVIWAQLPHGVIEGQLFGPRLQTLIAYMKGSLHASYTGLESFCQDVLNIDVARSYLCNTVARVSDALSKPYEQLAEHVPAEPILNIDESGWKDNGNKYWIWVFSTSLISFFHIAKSRSSRVLEEILGKTYGGTITSDFYSSYVKYSNRLQQFCLAHLIRDIKFLTTLPGKNDKRFGQHLLTDFQRLFHLWHLREKIPKDRFDRVMFRIKDRVLRLAEMQTRGERSKSRTLAKRLVKHGDAIFRFLFDPGVEPTNNAAERSIRSAVIDRRITQGSRSLKGRQWNARIWTILDTCKKQGRSSWQFLQDALSAHYFQTPTPSLLPQPA